MLALLVPGLGMGGGAAEAADDTAPVVCRHLDYAHAIERAPDYLHAIDRTLDTGEDC